MPRAASGVGFHLPPPKKWEHTNKWEREDHVEMYEKTGWKTYCQIVHRCLWRVHHSHWLWWSSVTRCLSIKVSHL